MVNIRLTVEPLGSIAVVPSTYEGFVGSAVRVDRDTVPYAEVLSGLRYRLADVGQSTERWGAQLEALERAVGARGTL